VLSDDVCGDLKLLAGSEQVLAILNEQKAKKQTLAVLIEISNLFTFLFTFN
jgi:hypothetical protein